MSSIITFPGDSRKYQKTIQKGRCYISCLEKRKDQNGILLCCSFQNKRLDNITRKPYIPHNCVFKQPYAINTITNYFQKINGETTTSFSLQNLQTRIILLVGQKNLSLSLPASEEFYDFVCFTLACGAANIHAEQPLLEQARMFFPPRKEHFYHDLLIETGKTIHQSVYYSFRECPYVCVAIDEGSIHGTKTLDFVLENPFHSYESYPYKTIELQGGKAKDYKPALIDGLSELSSYQIRLGTVVCDGNRAQKHCFSFNSTYTIRNYPELPLKQVIFIPCLCHRVNNAFKNAILSNENLLDMIQRLHNFAQECHDNKQIIGAVCPIHVSTRWLFDYDILNFLRCHRAKLNSLNKIPLDDEEFNILFEVATIFKHLISNFSSTTFPLPSAFSLLEQAFCALNFLDQKGHPFALVFLEFLQKQTLQSEYAGLFRLAYILTKKGHDDFRERIYTDLSPNYSFETLKQLFKIVKFTEIDPIEEAQTAAVDDDIASSFEEDFNDEEENQDETPIGDTNPVEHEEEEQAEPFETNILLSCKATLNKILKENFSFSESSAMHAVQAFSDYLDQPNPFEDCIVPNCFEGFKWNQISHEYPKFKPIADIAIRLINSVCSEASCERTLSAQKFIKNTRRMTSKKQLLDARLQIMRAQNKRK